MELTADDLAFLVTPLRERKDALVVYLNMKIKAQDWHAVQDAASDIRELDAQIDFIQTLARGGA